MMIMMVINQMTTVVVDNNYLGGVFGQQKKNWTQRDELFVPPPSIENGIYDNNGDKMIIRKQEKRNFFA